MGIYTKRSGSIDIKGISDTMAPVIGEWYNAEIEIIDPTIDKGAYNRITNVKNRPDPTIIWTGAARIQAMRWPNVATTKQEAISIRTVVFHIPLSEAFQPTFIMEGFRVHVLDGGMSPQFSGGMFVVTSSINSSYAWDRRIETMMDQGVILS